MAARLPDRRKSSEAELSDIFKTLSAIQHKTDDSALDRRHSQSEGLQTADRMSLSSRLSSSRRSISAPSPIRLVINGNEHASDDQDLKMAQDNDG